MISVLVCTHGSAAVGLVETAEMICGKQSQCKALAFTMGQPLEEFKQQVQQVLQSFNSSKVLCLTDLKGGTPFNILVNLTSEYPDLKIVTGVNVPMLLQTFIQRPNLELGQLLPEIIQAGKQGIDNYDINSINSENTESEEF
ncbi:PTS mannose transporter subunit IID [Bombilactobacillus bombi]|uniref:PTS mannose transporter subunit IID n=1 Tax=Bombilactobacillus bombi TaxID=1303590 RepID=A0A3R6ZZS3_9LACO|nr:PTS mannose transporter subunit IID [Bombilactobacillus bombi]RHW46281.1 PTS mannose transporter subunit IID [Bombilactobacillus bombi]RHW52376.1 PTS mannose transporter subunit IID [Bombilactobacillus bombi]